MNEDDIFRTMATVMNIAEEAADTWIPEAEEKWDVSIPVFSFTVAGDLWGRAKREKLYKAFVRNRLSAPVEKEESGRFFVRYK